MKVNAYEPEFPQLQNGLWGRGRVAGPSELSPAELLPWRKPELHPSEEMVLEQQLLALL